MHCAASIVSLGMCGAAVVIPLFLLPAFPAFTGCYGLIMSWYRLSAALFLVILSFYGCIMRCPYARLTLTAVTVYGVTVLASVLAINKYEPAYTGWQDEYGAFFMVVLFAVMMGRRSTSLVNENELLTGHLKEQVEEQTCHLKRLLTERAQLMSELGHDMKSPLTSLSNMAQIIRMNDIMLDGHTRERLQTIEVQCGILSERIASLQELAADAAVPSVMEPLSLKELLFVFYRDVRPVVEMSGPELRLQAAAGPCTVWGSAQKLRRVLENLVFNAVSFTPPDGTITLTLELRRESAHIQVSDNGCGIPEEAQPEIFSRFYTSREEDKGQGLGLAIARNIVLEHKGTLTVQSQAGKGSTFTIQLPLADTQIPYNR